jgi:hypothetical protein
MTAILNKEQVENLTYKQCQIALKLLFKTYNLEKPASKFSKEEWASCDAVCNTLLWLEERIKLFEDPRIPSMDPGMPIVVKPVKKVVDPTKSKRPPKRFSMDGVIYATAREASEKTGIKLGTLQTYVSRKPDRYFYLD